MAFHLQTKQELHALFITSFDLKMKLHHWQPQNTVRKKKGSIKHEMEKSHFSCHSSRTPALLTSNQVNLHWPLHLAAANPQITENFMIKPRLESSPFKIHSWHIQCSLIFSFSVSLSFSLCVSFNHNSLHSLLFWLGCVYGDQSGVMLW